MTQDSRDALADRGSIGPASRARLVSSSIAETNLSEPEDERAWMEVAACNETDPESFFAEPSTFLGLALHDQAEETCLTCTVRPECLEYGIDEEFGIWGGLDEDRRFQLRQVLIGYPARTKKILIRAAAERFPAY